MAVIDIVRSSVAEFVDLIVAALPRIIAGVAFLALAVVLVKLLLVGVRFVLRRSLPGDSPVYRQFVATIIAVFLWFGVALSFLSIVGLDGIAASLGTATGFLALGVSYALSGMIADAVSGVYLLRDPDFQPGDRVRVDDTTGVVKAIELRKTRLDVDGDTVVLANDPVESEWTKLGPAGEEPTAGDGDDESVADVSDVPDDAGDGPGDEGDGHGDEGTGAPRDAEPADGESRNDAVDGDESGDGEHGGADGDGTPGPA
jgi:hypothetical protein